MFLNNVQFVNGRATFLCCSATGPSSGPQLHAAERELDQQLLRRHAELGAASLCGREDGLVDASVPSPVSGQQHRQVDGGGCFKFASAFHDQHAVVVSNNRWITAAPLVTLFPPPQLEPVQSTHCSLYGLQTNVMHEVRVRCKMLGGKEFGEFGDSVFIHIPSKGKHLLQEAALSLSHSLTPGCSRVTSATGGRHFIITGRRLLLTPRTVSCLNHCVGKKNPLV